MIKNYFFLKRFCAEASREFIGHDAVSVFSQEKDKILFEFSRKDSMKNRFLEISVNPGTPYLALKQTYTRAKKNTIDFFTGYFPSSLISTDIAEYDRIIRFGFEHFSIYFTIRGKYTNVVLISKGDEVSAFKKTDSSSLESFLNEIKNTKFIHPLEQNHFDFETFTGENYTDDLRKKYPVISKEVFNEIKLRNRDNSKEELIGEIKKIINEIKEGTPAVFINRGTGEIRLAVDSFKLFEEWEINRFNHLTDAVNFYLSKKHYLEEGSRVGNLVKKNIEKELARVSWKMNDVKARIDRGSREKEYQKTANLLLININLIKKGSDNIETDDLYNQNERIKIKLDPELSPLANADHYFELAKKERIGYEKSLQLYEELKAKLDMLKKKKKELEKMEAGNENLDSFNQLKKELRIKEGSTPAKAKDDLSEKFKHYLIAGKYHAFVGKDSVNNDLLTTKFAKQNDYWFHARGVSGSHLVLRVQNSYEKIPKNILKDAASIAAYHSKAKTSGLAPVSFSQKKYVVKKKGMEPGKVALLREEVLIVKPEIPKNTEFISKQIE